MAELDIDFLNKAKDLSDSVLTSLGMIPPDKLMKLVQQHEETINKLIKKVSSLEKKVRALENKKNPSKNRRKSDDDIDDFDSL